MSAATAALTLCLAVAPLPTAAAPTPSPSAIDSTRVAVLPIEFRGVDDAGRRAFFDARLREGLQRTGSTPVKLQWFDPDDERCRTPACVQRVARTADARYVLDVRIAVIDRVYTVDIELLDRETGRSVVGTSESCEVCGMHDVGALIGNQAAALWVKLDDLALRPPLVRLQSDPPGATVEVDGRVVGRTPLEQAMGAGRHRVRFSLPGHAALERDVIAVPGTDERLTVELLALPAAPRDERREAALRGTGWGLFTTGLLAIAAGSTLLALDGRDARSRCSGSDRDGFGNCRYLYETTAGGAAATALGATTLAAGIGLAIAFRARRERDPANQRAANRRSANRELQWYAW